ncbi:hypothetical protein RB195_008877 [Necator americanus]
MVYSVFVLLAIVGTVTSSCQTWPNGTDTKFHWWQCSSGPVKYYSAEPYDETGTKMVYPIHLSAPAVIRCDMENPKNVYTSPSLRLKIKLWLWGTPLGGCEWFPVPTLGLLNNLDACQHGIKCPIPIGRQKMDVVVDFTKFSAIVHLLKDDKPYQLQYELHDESSGDTSCIVAQARARTV